MDQDPPYTSPRGHACICGNRGTTVASGMDKPFDHDSYIAAAAPPLRPLLVQLRAQIAGVMPDAQEIFAYNMPGFGFGTSIIVGYAAFSKQCGIYLSHATIATHADAIAAEGLRATKMGVTFSPAKPISDALVAQMVQTARAELGL